ncbi:TPA_exp: Uncharacterized protein A8136_2809 [Trichophyton benhamiae CBS 112371]|uniref:Uncharacterized protein n=1 Tax=Arthroderma benhamiae (strain ATCC MYA-4681 / CBS 112371) TaxID=663331 RepID=D4ALF9_ARTBC|nr:uncharacterized protein ARB_05156 [Trichophyton benhamiae CBS 112371]EFE36218.1 hypothetical protein ARB_05156 [Trichophyton benhamiae CBS 112371]DAA79024.1 TPA_exp: Uncharacterized protein A8136_2809 [Trichophyton benhamiae CBS 112371]
MHGGVLEGEEKRCDCDDMFCYLDADECIEYQAYQAQLIAALRGEQVPDEEHLDNQYHAPLCLIRGIRCHYEFAASSAVKDVCVSRPALARARNARLIMSNVIPGPEDMDDTDRTRHPYCIWNPDIAAEDTYRQLAQRFPSMRYQVGRACAAAGYDGLYAELDLLPDVSIAEEARESETPGGQAIFKMIMAAPYRYAIMNDYDLSINLDSKDPGAPAFLNGHTTVRWKLQHRKELQEKAYNFRIWRARTWKWSIEEDDHLDEKESRLPDKYNTLTPEEVRLLYTPLPQDLPTMKKDLHIQMAAYDGNVDRYARLASYWPMDEVERVCVIRGIYYNTMFARFWAEEIKQNTRRVQGLKKNGLSLIKEAISARRIMINDVEEFINGWPEGEPQPRVIWKPLKPCEHVLKLLAERVPSMKKTAALACIFCDYEDAYNEINCTPHPDLAMAAKRSLNPFYLRDIKQKAAEQGIDLYKGYVMPIWLDESLEILKSHSMYTNLTDGMGVHWSDDVWKNLQSVFGGDVPEDYPVQLYVWASPERLRLLDICETSCPCPARYYPDYEENWEEYVERAKLRKERMRREEKHSKIRAAAALRRPGESEDAWKARQSLYFLRYNGRVRAGEPEWVEFARKAKEKYEAIVASEGGEVSEHEASSPDSMVVWI